MPLVAVPVALAPDIVITDDAYVIAITHHHHAIMVHGPTVATITTALVVVVILFTDNLIGGHACVHPNGSKDGEHDGRNFWQVPANLWGKVCP